jgi:acetylcholinesterase
MANTGKKPMFHKAIMESGAPTARALYPYDSDLHQKQFEEFLQETGSSDVREDQIIPHLRTLPVSTIVAASQNIYYKYGLSLRWAFQPVIEGPGGYISKAPIAAWSSGSWHKMPILTGFNTDEGASFAPPGVSKSSQFRDFFRTLLPALSSPDLDTLESLYPDPATNPSSPYRERRQGLGEFKRMAAAYGQFAYIAPVRQTVIFASATESASPPNPPAYLYQFDVNKIQWGAKHGDQQDFSTYGSDVAMLPKVHEKIAGWMHGYWTSFILTGDPNAVTGRWPDRPHWPAYRAGGGERIVFGGEDVGLTSGEDKVIDAKVVPDTYAQKECEFWWSKTETIERWR